MRVKGPPRELAYHGSGLVGSVSFLNPSQLKSWLVPVRTNMFRVQVMINNAHDKQDSYLRMHP